MSECPHSIPPHQCVTITDLVTNSTDTSINDGMSINVFFIAGTHVPKTDGWIIVGNPYLDQEVSATFTAILDEQNQQNVIIDCESGHPISFVFLQLLSLTLKNVELQNCGFKLHFNTYSSIFLDEITSSVVVMDVPELVIANINITSSRGAGMVIILTDFHRNVSSNLLMLNEIVINGSIPTRNTVFRGNLHVTFIASQENTCRKPTTISITNSTFSNGIGGPANFPDDVVFGSSSGGLTLSMVNLHNVSILINRCKFIGNKAHNGGGIRLFVQHKDEHSDSLRFNNRIHITKSIFSRNTAVRLGGGFAIILIHHNISEAVFRSAGFGGAAFAQFSFDKCTFIGNEARLGAAIYNSGNRFDKPRRHQQISNCTFMNNTCMINTATCRTDEEREETGTIHVEHGKFLRIEDVEITGNDCRGIYLYDTDLLLSGTSVINGNHARQSDGGAILFECTIQSSLKIFFFFKLTTLSITNNTADGNGGGIAIRHCGNEHRSACIFIQPTHKITIIMKHNTAMKGGDAIYGGYLENCKLWDIFDIMERNTSSAVSSPPNKVCICSDDFPQKHTCSLSMQLDTYPGQRFQVPLVCVGQYDYSSSCKVQADLVKSIAKIAGETPLQNIGLQCKQLYYSIETQQTNYTEAMSLTIVKEQDINYKWRNQIARTVLEIRIKACPPGFINAKKCTCTDYLASNGITCNIDEERLYKTSSMWVGNYSGDVVVHQVCPFDYCKSNFTKVDPFNQQEQCDFNRSDVLCGACRPGLSLALGTSQCKECSNINHLFLILFALAGVVLVVLLLKCNLTVSTGTINGLIFYANTVRSTQTAFFPSSTDNKFVRVLSVFVAWVNLDLGIETCFVNGLNTYYRTWLQFIFPLYIWTIVGLLILISRYSIKVSKWTGSNTVSVLATLFLLSYAKLLRTTFDTFSSTTLTDINGTTTILWLLDGRYTFLEWPHSLLFAAGLFILLAHILPFTILLLMAPILQRYTHYKLLRWVNKLKPLLDAYQGPYGIKSRYWTGLLLLARLIILTAVSLNVSGKQAINLLVIIIVLSIIMATLIVFNIGTKLYTSKLSNFLELFFLANLLLLTATLLFLQTNQSDKISGQSITICCMVGSAFAMCGLILVYHCYVVCQRIEAIKRLTSRVVSSLKGPQNRALTNDDIICGPPHSTPPTVTEVDLRELLLEDN